MNFKNFKNVLFDLDGTVTDPIEGAAKSIKHSLKYYPGLDFPEGDELRKFIGPPLVDSYMRYYKMDEKTALEAVSHYREYYSEGGVLENDLYQGLTEVFESLKKAGKKLYVATTKLEKYARKILNDFDIAKYFDGIYGSTADGRITQKDEVIKELLKNEKINAEETVMIGDTPFDIEGARLCGIGTISVTYGYGTKEEIKKSNPIAVVNTPKEITELLLDD